MSESNFEYSGNVELNSIEQNFKKYNQFIVQKIIKNLQFGGNETKRILDYGAGRGGIAEILRDKIQVNPECLELDQSNLALLKSKGFICHSDLQKVDGNFDFVYTINVLEHIDNDAKTLQDLHTKIKTEGKLLIYVPAFPKLFNSFDAHLGHYRRYDKNDLEKLLVNNGFHIEASEFVDSIGYFAWRITKKNRNGHQPKLDEMLLKIYSHVLWPTSRILDNMGFNKWFGKNILVIANRK
jgi:SAM-dependent methyltransferase